MALTVSHCSTEVHNHCNWDYRAFLIHVCTLGEGEGRALVLYKCKDAILQMDVTLLTIAAQRLHIASPADW